MSGEPEGVGHSEAAVWPDPPGGSAESWAPWSASAAGGIGTCVSIRKTRGPERFLWVPYFVLSPIGVRIWNRNKFRNRREESEGRGGVG
jgi:hypothetical protein